jgi:predicted TIM-barrel fold metal-dependent hydrolase
MVDLVEFLTHAPRPSEALCKRVDPDPRLRRYTIISVDDHFIEPPDLFHDRLPRRFVDVAPRVIRRDGADWWTFGDQQVPLLGADAVQTWVPGHGYSGPVTFEELRPGTWRPADRVRDMDISGVAASLNFPSTTWGFAGRVFMHLEPDLGIALVRAYNDWIYETWSSVYPDRFIACQLTWLLDPELAAREIVRNAARGFKAVTFTENPAKLGLASMHQTHWDPLLRACEETETVINLHVGSSSETVVPGPDSTAVIGILFPINAFTACADWLYAGVPVRHPKIKIAFSEGGIGWVPMLLDRIEYGRRHGSSADRHVFGDLEPAELLQRNFWFTTFSDPRTLALRHDIGVSRIMLETDYPHSDSSWPDTQELVARQLDGLPADDVACITWKNASELYRHPAS